MDDVKKVSSTLGVGEGPATRAHCYGALGVSVALALSAGLAVFFGLGQGPQFKLIVPISATVWSLADLVTAFLLAMQFYVHGKLSFAILAVAYGISGLLTWPFLLTFPGVLITPSTLAGQSTFVYFWMAWHFIFPLLAMASMLGSWPATRLRNRRSVLLATAACAVLPVLATAAVVAGVFAARDVLPLLMIDGRLQPIDRLAFHPTIMALNALACLFVLGRRGTKTILQVWLCVALLSAALDSFLVNFGGKLYTFAWDVGKCIAVVTAAVVLTIILTELVRLYSRQSEVNDQLERDLLARKRAEAALRASDERFRQVEEHAPIGLALMSLEGAFVRVNPALCRLTGYAKRKLLETSWQALTHPDDVAPDLALSEDALRGTIAKYELEERYVLDDRRIVWVLSTCTLVRDDDGQPSYFIRQIQDIEARKAAEREVEIAQSATLAVTEAKSQLIATMSHEIRTPMNGIIGMAELLSLTPLNGDQNEYVQVIRDSGESLLRILNDILDYSKIEAGKLELENVEFDLRSQVRSVIALLEPQFKAKGVTLATEVDDNVPALVSGDPGRVRQVLINLIANAFNFTPAGGTVHALAAAYGERDATVPVRFTIVDDGPGIPRDVRHRLFQPFSQADRSTTRNYGGTGLGLSICKQLVDLMGGRIGVTSEVGSGSSFWFTVPFVRGSRTTPVLDAPAREMGERRAVVARRAERVLLAEDNQINVLLATKQLKRLGFDVTVVGNGREAVDAVRRQRFDIVFMDCHMPLLDGFEATKEIRLEAGDGPRVPIVAMTADARNEDRAACLAAGMDAYVAKPVSLSDLETVLAQLLPNPAYAAARIAEV